MAKWRKVKGFGSMYSVSNDGRVFSHHYDREKTLSADKDGYLVTKLQYEKEFKTMKVHRLVAIAFIGNPSKLPQVNHIDGNKQNNNASNLEWISNKNNSIHSLHNGLTKTKLTKKDVKYIRDSKETQKQLSSRFKVAISTISRIINKKRWGSFEP